MEFNTYMLYFKKYVQLKRKINFSRLKITIDKIENVKINFNS